MSENSFEKELELLLHCFCLDVSVWTVKIFEERNPKLIHYNSYLMNEFCHEAFNKFFPAYYKKFFILHKKYSKQEAVKLAKKAVPTAELIHEYYLEATRELNPESYNAKAQKSFRELTNEQQYIDRFIVKKILDNVDRLSKEIK